MTIKTIEINKTQEIADPIIRLASVPPSSVWQYVGQCMAVSSSEDDGTGRDLNRATQAAAKELSKKLSPRKISIEVVIDPLIPVTNIPSNRMEPLIVAIGENASAAVEPGPGTIVLRTWWRGGYAGVDAIGIDATLPDVIKENLMRPGFTTRVGEWDTGLGLHEAKQQAAEINGLVELFDPKEDNGVGFRFAIPLKSGTPLGSPEARLGLSDEPDEPTQSPPMGVSWYFPTICDPLEVDCHVHHPDQCKA